MPTMRSKGVIAAAAMLTLSAACAAAASVGDGTTMQGVDGLHMIVDSSHMTKVRYLISDELSCILISN